MSDNAIDTQYAIRNTQPPLLLIVTGHPGSGKTTLARGLSFELSLPLINKDGFKEIIFDGLGWSDREWSQRLGGVSYDLLFYVTRQMLAGGVSLIVESNFDPQRNSAELASIARENNARTAQVLCRTESTVLIRRFMSRADSPERHPGHYDHLAETAMRERMANGDLPPLDLDGPLVVVDTTNFANAEPRLVADQLLRLLGQ